MPPLDPSTLPALLGGLPIRPQGPPDWPLADDAVRQALEAALHDGSWGKYSGGNVARLEKRLASWLELPHVLTCGSGTFAVEAALRAVQVGRGDEVVLAGYDYPGNFLSVHAVEARPVLIDVAPGNWNLASAMLPAALGPAVKAVIVSHLHGGLAAMREAAEICAERGVALIEDAAQAPGATVQGRPAGTWGDVGVLSFGGSKLLAPAGAGLVTRRADIYQRARLLLGRGNNLVCPLSELQAAVLLPQLDALPERHARRAQAVAQTEVAPGGRAGAAIFRQRGSGIAGLLQGGPAIRRGRVRTAARTVDGSNASGGRCPGRGLSRSACGKVREPLAHGRAARRSRSRPCRRAGAASSGAAGERRGRRSGGPGAAANPGACGSAAVR